VFQASRLFDLPDVFKIIDSSSVDQPLAIMRIAELIVKFIGFVTGGKPTGSTANFGGKGSLFYLAV
jgi:hypothetical protein